MLKLKRQELEAVREELLGGKNEKTKQEGTPKDQQVGRKLAAEMAQSL
jgi:hypothetical protein